MFSLLSLAAEPSLHVRTGPEWQVGRSEDGATLALKCADGKHIRLSVAWTPHYETANQQLGAGVALATLCDETLAAASKDCAQNYFGLLEQLCRSDVLEFPLVHNGEELAVILPQWEACLPRLAPATPPPDRSLDRFACLRREGGSWLVESPLSGARVRLFDLAALDAPLVRRALAGAGLLETEQQQDASRRDALAQWEFHDLLFHVHQRMGWHRDPTGAHFPFIGDIEPLPAKRPDWPGDPVDLPGAPGAPGAGTFADVLARRRSETRYDEAHPLSLQELGALLDRCARVGASRTVALNSPSGRFAAVELTERPYPSAGACYELEIYPVVNRCDGLEPGMYHYDAFRHALTRIPARKGDIDRLIANAKQASSPRWAANAMPQVVLAITARFARATWKYRSIGYGNILRNTGALYQTLYLAATELGLSPCALGSGNSALFARATGLDPVVEGTVGEFLVGGRSRR